MSSSPSASLPEFSSTPTEATNEEGASRTQHPEWGRVVARVVYLVLTSTSVLLFVVSLPTYDAQLRIVCPGLPSCSFFGQLSQGTLPWFQRAHLSVSAYAAAFLALTSLDGLLSLLVGIVIVWRLWGKENERLGLLTSFVLIVGGTIGNGSGSFSNFSSALLFFLNIVGSLSFFLYWPATGMVLVTFPTGRFAPRWSWLVILLFVIQIFLYGLLEHEASPLLFAAERLLIWGSAFAVLAWRYRHLFTSAQRQQTKWLLYGYVPFYLVYLLYGALQTLPALRTPDSLYLVVGPVFQQLYLLIVPLAFGIALLRYRLRDIDVLINRTLVYGLLTVTLLLIYVLLVFGGQTLLASVLGSNNAVVLVVSTLLVAALFQPLRQRVQQLVDRRFYRRKYDATQVLAAFSVTVRDEVDLEQVRERLLAVVQETIQPASVSLWVRPLSLHHAPWRTTSADPSKDEAKEEW